MGYVFQRIWFIRLYRSLHFYIYFNYWFSLCMAKRSLGMVLISKYSNCGNEVRNSMKSLINSVEAPLLDQKTPNSIFKTTFNDFSNWARLSNLWPLLYGTSCCFIKFASLIGSRFDFDRYSLVPRSSPRQADLIITAGTVIMKMAPSLVRLYEQMPEPKYVIAMGACTITGGMFSTDSYSTVRGVDKLIHVDIYLPSCPPKPEAIIDAITKLRKKVAQETYGDKTKFQRGNRYSTLKHQFHSEPTIHTRQYNERLNNQFYKYQLNSTLGIPLQIIEKEKGLISSQKNKNERGKDIQKKEGGK